MTEQSQSTMPAKSYQFISVARKGKDGNIYVITLQKPPENRLNVAACRELVGAYHDIVSSRFYRKTSRLTGAAN